MSRTSLVACVLGPALLLLGACDVPTESPVLDHTWQVPGDDTRIGVADFLPSGVSLTPDSSAFDVSVNPFSFDEDLGTLCPDCGPLHGTTAPKPAFEGSFENSVELPVDVVAATVSSGRAEVVLQNGFGFDPIRPGGGNTGTLTLTFRDGPDGRVLDRVILDGTTDSMPPGSSTTVDLSIEPGSVGTTVAADIHLDSPEGDPILIDTTHVVGADATVQELLVSDVTVNADGRSVDFASEPLDLEDVDPSVTDAVQSGALILDITNPFGAGVEGGLEISGPGFGTMRKPLDISADPTSTTTLRYTGDELRSFLGEPGVTIGGDGTVTAPGPVTVTPTHVLTVQSTVEAVLRLNQ